MLFLSMKWMNKKKKKKIWHINFPIDNCYTMCTLLLCFANIFPKDKPISTFVACHIFYFVYFLHHIVYFIHSFGGFTIHFFNKGVRWSNINKIHPHLQAISSLYREFQPIHMLSHQRNKIKNLMPRQDSKSKQNT